jgi:transcriptional regulator GlxA family with amidase domain
VQIAAVLFPRLTALDIVGPYDVLQHLPDTRVVFVGHEPGLVRADKGSLALMVDAAFEAVTEPDIVIVPGGAGTDALVEDERALEWLRTVHAGTRFTTSVCTGSLVLGAAGLLDGLPATTHWGQMDALSRFGAIPTPNRVVENVEQRIITSAGVSSGIDMALRLAELLVDETAAKALQLLIEYDPQPRYDCGNVTGAPADVIERLVRYATT